jgi:hypothetical protein
MGRVSMVSPMAGRNKRYPRPIRDEVQSPCQPAIKNSQLPWIDGLIELNAHAQAGVPVRHFTRYFERFTPGREDKLYGLAFGNRS